MKTMKKISMLLFAIIILFGLKIQTQAFAYDLFTEKDFVQNPRTTYEFDKKCVKYSMITFGEYPQAEVISSTMTKPIKDKYLQSGDIIVDSTLYAHLREATWDSKNEALVDGYRYRRIQKEDVITNVPGYETSYDWTNLNPYHYFRYEPIKWRVLSRAGDKVLLLADRILDDKKFNENPDDGNVWSTSGMRSWLNNDFYNAAFSDRERGYIYSVQTKPDHLTYPSVYGGSTVADKVFLLSDIDTGDRITAPLLGFEGSNSTSDLARKCKSTTFSRARGVDWNQTGYSCWWLRSPGYMKYYTMIALENGVVNSSGFVNYPYTGVRPAIMMDMSTSSPCKYDGVLTLTSLIKKNEQIITATDKNVPINQKTGNIGATTNGGGKFTYTSSVPSVATVSSSGVITPKKYGSTVITIQAAETTFYKGATKQIVINVIPKKMTLSSVKSPSKKKVIVKWKIDKTVKGYDLNVSETKTFEKYKTMSNKTLKKKASSLKLGILNRKKTYYFRIRSYVKTGGKTYYGPWSKTKSVKVK